MSIFLRWRVRMSVSTYLLGRHCVTMQTQNPTLNQWVDCYLAPFFDDTTVARADWFVDVTEDPASLACMIADFNASSRMNGTHTDEDHAISWTATKTGEWLA